MKHLEIEGITLKLTYFTLDEISSGEYLHLGSDLGAWAVPNSFVREYVSKFEDVIPVLAYWPPNGLNAYFFHYLYWPMSVDRVDLDQKILTNKYTYVDFDKSILTSFSTIFCTLGCHWRWKVLKVSQELYDPKVVKRKHDLQYLNRLPCPNCGLNLRLPVVKIFGQDEEHPIQE